MPTKAIIELLSRVSDICLDTISGHRQPTQAAPAPPLDAAPPELRSTYPSGHFYSPVVDPAEVEADLSRIWPEPPVDVAGVDFNDASHRHVLGTLFPRFYPDFDYPEEGAGDDDLSAYYIRNSQFSWLDARTLFVLLRAWRPARIIEVGSGYSTLLIRDVARRFLGDACSIIAIEPFPRPFLSKIGVDLIEAKVQAVPHAVFETLGDGDILFIDSSHVSKTGSDINYLFFEIFPKLKPGVRIHIHDIFLPADYPKEWVIDENRSWNEQYLLRALLMYSVRFRVVFGCAHAYHRHRAMLLSALGVAADSAYGGGSLWMEVRA